MVSTTGEQYAYYGSMRAAAGAARTARARCGSRSSGSRRIASRRLHRAVHGRRRRLAARRRHREPGAADALGQGGADLRHLRRRAGLCLAGRRHHLHGRCDRACPPTPSAMCRRRPWSRRSNSPCASRTTRRWAGTGPGRPLATCWPTAAPTAARGTRQPLAAARPRGAPMTARRRPPCCRTAGACTCSTGRSTSIIEAFGAPATVRRAYAQAAARFATILDELVANCRCCAQPPTAPAGPARTGRPAHGCAPSGPIARRLHHADGRGCRRGGRRGAGARWPRRRRSRAPM